MDDFHKLSEAEAVINTPRQEEDEEEVDPERSTLHRPLLKENQTLSSNSIAVVGVGAKVSHIESLDYE